MEHLSLRDITPLPTYRKGRDEYVRRMIAYKAKRRLLLADHVSILFENRQTVLFQVQELAHSEDLTDTRELQEYLDIYNPMIPGDGELSATLFIEADQQELLKQLLGDLRGIEHHVFLAAGATRTQAVFEEEHTGDVTSSVHYIKFPLSPAAKEYLRTTPADQARVDILVTHPQLQVHRNVPLEVIQSLQEDLANG